MAKLYAMMVLVPGSAATLCAAGPGRRRAAPLVGCGRGVPRAGGSAFTAFKFARRLRQTAGFEDRLAGPAAREDDGRNALSVDP